MKIPNSSRIHIENDSVSSNFDLSDKKQNYLFGGNINNKTEQIRLKRNLLQSKYPIKNDDQAESVHDQSENSLIQEVPETPQIPLITYEEAYNYFNGVILKEDNNQQEKDDCCSCSSSKTNREKAFILNLSRIRYNPNNDIHFRILFKIYYFFKKKNCPKEGEHWQDIGFQSDSPEADLLSVGMFGPLQILFGIDKYPVLYTNLFKYLLVRKCELYFMVNLISMCKFSLNSLERDLLNDFVNERESLTRLTNEVYVGMGNEYFKEIQKYGSNNTLTIEYIVKTIKKISEKRTNVNYFIKNHTSFNNI